MPIRINLLAEAQAAEELRRRDPVKRAILAGVLLVALALVWWSSLQLRAIVAKSTLGAVEAEIQSRTNEYHRVMSNQQEVSAAEARLSALQRLSDARFLNGNLLNALQKATVEGVALTRLKVQQSYFLSPGTAPQTNDNRVLPGKPGKVTERIMVTLDARDSGANPGDQVNKFKEAIAQQPYFKAMLDATNGIRLTDLSAPQMGPDQRPYVLFTIECHYPDHTR
jgi:hypothetical protein